MTALVMAAAFLDIAGAVILQPGVPMMMSNASGPVRPASWPADYKHPAEPETTAAAPETTAAAPETTPTCLSKGKLPRHHLSICCELGPHCEYAGQHDL